MMAGHFTNPFQQQETKKISYYIYGQAIGSLVGYDASLQGGLFTRKNPYVIPGHALSRFTLQVDAGHVLITGKLSLGYHQSWLSKEFKTGQKHRWGGLYAGLSFN